MIRKPLDGQNTTNFTGNDRYEGYCVDLGMKSLVDKVFKNFILIYFKAEKIAQKFNFTYEFQLVKDKKFGSISN